MLAVSLAIVPEIILTASSLDTRVKTFFVSENEFLAIPIGSSLASVKAKLGLAARHEFTVSKGDAVYTYVSCLVYPEGSKDFIAEARALHLLFLNQNLVNIHYWIRRNKELRSYERTSDYVAKNPLRAPSLSPEQIHRTLIPYSGPGANGSGNIPAIVFLPFVVAGTPESFIQYGTNEERLKIYDVAFAHDWE